MHPSLNIIVVEDHDALRDITVEALRSQGHQVVGVESAEALDRVDADSTTDLMVIDLNLPGEDGISLSRRLRAARPDMGIVMVTARTLSADRARGYDSGADLYLTKPASIEELGAAVNALGRRLRRPANDAAGTETSLVLDRVALSLRGPGETVGLGTQEAAVLVALSEAPERRLGYSELMELLGKAPLEYRKASLEVQMARLRKKLVQAGAGTQPIKAVRHFGYQLCARLVLA